MMTFSKYPGYSGNIPDNPGYSKSPAQGNSGYSRNKTPDNPGNFQRSIREKPGKAGKIPENRFAPVNFSRINETALSVFPELLARWLPDGSVRNGEWVALNPTRPDRKAGSFMINVRSGKWADFATGDRGGDVVSLVAYLTKSSQSSAARQLAGYLGVNHA